MQVVNVIYTAIIASYTNLVKFVYLLVVVKYGNILEMKNNNLPLKQIPPQKYLKVKNPPHIVIQTKFWYILGSPKTTKRETK